jgi:hypothetical protein
MFTNTKQIKDLFKRMGYEFSHVACNGYQLVFDKGISLYACYSRSSAVPYTLRIRNKNIKCELDDIKFLLKGLSD